MTFLALFGPALSLTLTPASTARVQQQTETWVEGYPKVRPYRGSEAEKLPVEILKVRSEEHPLFYRIISNRDTEQHEQVGNGHLFQLGSDRGR